MTFEIKANNIRLDSFYLSPRNYDPKNPYITIDIILMAGEQELSKSKLEVDDLSDDFKNKIVDFQKEIEEALEIEVMRKAKQLPPHLDESIETIEGEVS